MELCSMQYTAFWYQKCKSWNQSYWLKFMSSGKFGQTSAASSNTQKKHLRWKELQEKLLKNQGSMTPLTEQEIMEILNAAIPQFLAEQSLLEFKAPVVICGDIHGQFEDLLRLYNFIGWPPEKRYLFLGDYVDRGQQSVEVICLQILLKLQYPKDYFLLRGNHEHIEINRCYGFYEECKTRYSRHLWHRFQNFFACMPLAALVSEKILCMHGGISSELKNFDQIRHIRRPTSIPPSGVLCDLLWADPDGNANGYGESPRGAGCVFGANAVFEFCDNMGIDLIARAHQVVEQGYQFFAQRRCVTVFSAPNYCNIYNNAAAALIIDQNLNCKIVQIKSSTKKKK
ncbi:Serine/threonine-protein phosphatase PP1 [Trichinella pseudospiralis]|uniref:Serine/threonine-protein phosphatase n=1 Tax=Trichinella pseudospiralis TaxID=6337 RepID=A0A0V1G0D7_TRIPS|nr:Serine/threonine-protein phosphatase PP1 [Trichinella pseudospiralis]